MNNEEVAITKQIAQRMKEGREMSGLTQVEAAERLGFANSSGLSKIENLRNGTDARTIIPLWVIVKAAKVYELSADWFLCLTDDWEADARLTERSTAHWVYEAWAKARERDLKAMAALDKRIREISDKAGDVANHFLTLYYSTPRDILDFSQQQKWELMKKRSESVRRMMEKLKLHKKDSRDQLVISLIGGGDGEA